MKKIFKKLFNLTCAVAMMSYMFAPLSVLATNSITIVFEVENGAAFGIAPTGTDKGPLKVSVVSGQGGDDISFKGTGGAGIDDDVTITCDSQVKCTAVITGQSEVSLMYHDDFMDITEGPTLIGTSTKFTQGTTLSIKEPAQQNPPSGGGEGGGVPHPNFNGETVLFWSCGNKTCYHYYDDMQVVNNGVYIKDSTITADNVQGEKFDALAETKFFADPTRAAEYLTEHQLTQDDITNLDTKTLVGPGGIDYMPVGEPYLNNAYVSYGDRNFKAIIYNDKFRGISVGSLAGLTYYPGAWQNELTRQDAYDLSGTTKDDPVEIHTVLLESNINLKSLDYNGFAVKSIEALDVPADAVTITKKNDGSYDFKFSSRFYDKVVFKVTDTNDKVYYMRIKREAIALNTMHAEQGKLRIYGELYYDKSNSWTDFLVTAKIVHKDGSSELKVMTNANWIDDGLGNSANIEENDEEHPYRPEWPVGKGLKRAGMKIDFTQDELKDIDYVYVNVTYKGSTSTLYNGAYVGSGKGEVIDLREAR